MATSGKRFTHTCILFLTFSEKNDAHTRVDDLTVAVSPFCRSPLLFVHGLLSPLRIRPVRLASAAGTPGTLRLAGVFLVVLHMSAPVARIVRVTWS